MTNGAPPRGNTVTVGDLDLHYLSYGDGPPVVFLHGSGPGASGFSNFKQNVQAVVDCDHRAVLIDMPGFGYSSKPVDRDYTTEFFADAVTGLLDAIDIESAVLVGNSLGGGICIRIALDQPQRVSKLVMMAPGGIEDRETYFAMPGMVKMVERFVGGALDRDGLGEILQLLVYDKSQVDEALIDERWAILQDQPPEVLSRMKIPSMAGELGSLACPILGFWGVDDEMTPASGAQKFLDQCRDCRFTLVTQCGHWVMVEHHDLFNAALTDFLVRG